MNPHSQRWKGRMDACHILDTPSMIWLKIALMKKSCTSYTGASFPMPNNWHLWKMLFEMTVRSRRV